MRNAAYHDRWQERTFGSNVIELHETEASLRSLTPPQIYGRLRDYYRDVHDFTHCILWRATASLKELCGRPPITVALAAAFTGKPHDPALADEVRAVLDSAVGAAVARLQSVNWSPRAKPDPIPSA